MTIMDEKQFEQILIKNPDLIEEGLVFKGSQVNLEGKRLDLLYEDENGQELVVEVKLVAKRKDVAQLIDYAGYFIAEKKIPVRVMLVALRIPVNLRHSFDYFGFEYKEIKEVELLQDRIQTAPQEAPQLNFQGPTLQNNNDEAGRETRERTFGAERNLTRQEMASRIKRGRLFGQAKRAIDFLTKSQGPVRMKEFVAYMKSVGYESKSYYDLFNALCDSGLVRSTSLNGHKAYSLVDE